MTNKTVDLKDEIQSYKFEFGLLKKVPCTKEENAEYACLIKNGCGLPDGVFAYIYGSSEPSTTEFYTIEESDLSEAEINEYLTYKKLSMIKTIKNCAVFFTVLTVVGILVFIMTTLGVI